MHQVCQQKIYALAEAQIVLDNRLSAESTNTLDRVLDTLRVQHNRHGSFGVMTTHKMFELTVLASHCERSGHWIRERARQWALACETSAGFGVWPRSGPRLSSTYQCLHILQRTGGIRLPDSNCHISWMRSFQIPDGSFRGPWSHRPRWEDTFHAAAALRLLGSSLDGHVRDLCLEWVRRTLIREGIEKGQIDAFHDCLAVADALRGLDAEMLRTAGEWLSSELDRLLLTHVGHNAENIHHVVHAYDILRKSGISIVHPERITLLTHRINDALEAELAALRI